MTAISFSGGIEVINTLKAATGNILDISNAGSLGYINRFAVDDFIVSGNFAKRARPDFLGPDDDPADWAYVNMGSPLRDFSNSRTFLAIHWKEQAIQQRPKVDSVANGGVRVRCISDQGGENGANFREYVINGDDARHFAANNFAELSEAWVFNLINPRQTTTSFATGGTFDDATIDDLRFQVHINDTFAQDNALTIWSFLMKITPHIMVGGDGGDTDGIFEDFRTNIINNSNTRPYPKQGANQIMFLIPIGIGDGSTATEFTDNAPESYEFPTQAGVITDHVMSHHVANDLGLEIDCSASDLVTIGAKTFNSLTKYYFNVIGSTAATVLFQLNCLFTNAGEISMTSAVTFDSCTFDGCDKVVMT